jgi:chromosome segregation ATPase
MGQVDEAPKAGEDVSHLKKKIVELSEEVVELKHIEDDLSGEVDKLKKENKDLKEEISELHLQTNYLNEQLDAKGDQVVADYKAREEKLTQQLKDKEEEIKVGELYTNPSAFVANRMVAFRKIRNTTLMLDLGNLITRRAPHHRKVEGEGRRVAQRVR